LFSSFDFVKFAQAELDYRLIVKLKETDEKSII